MILNNKLSKRGGWVCCHLLSSPIHEDFVACAIGHPSVHLEELAWGGSNQALFDTVQKPVLLMPANVCIFVCPSFALFICVVLGSPGERRGL